MCVGGEGERRLGLGKVRLFQNIHHEPILRAYVMTDKVQKNVISWLSMLSSLAITNVVYQTWSVTDNGF